MLQPRACRMGIQAAITAGVQDFTAVEVDVIKAIKSCVFMHRSVQTLYKELQTPLALNVQVHHMEAKLVSGDV